MEDTLDRFMNMGSLDMGVIMTFHPTDSDLLTYLYRKISNPNNEAFPEICIYGKEGLPPWEIWRVYQPLKFPLQDFIYFFSWAKKNKSRCSRTVGSNGGTWSEGGAKPIYVAGNEEEPYGILRKFRYETRKDTSFEHHGAWLMDEYTIIQAPDLALCRLKAKANDMAEGGNKRKYASENENVTRKNRKLQPARSYQQESSASMPSHSHHGHQQNLSNIEEQQEFDAREMFSLDDMLVRDDRDHALDAQSFSADDLTAQSSAAMSQILMSDDPNIHHSDSEIEAYRSKTFGHGF